MGDMSVHGVSHGILISTILIVVFSSTSYAIPDPTQRCGVMEEEISDTSAVLSKLLNYFQSHFMELNLDGLTGIQLARGILLNEITTGRSSYAPTSFLSKLIIDFEEWMAKIATKTVPVIALKYPTYYSQLRQLADRPVLFSRTTQPLRGCPNWTTNSSQTRSTAPYDEKYGDQCLSQALGTASPDGTCSVTSDCWEQMVPPAYIGVGYTITHGIIYLLLLKYNGCEVAEDVDVDLIIHDLCCRVKTEFDATISNLEWALPTSYFDDIASEQALICTIAGYQGFLSDRLHRHLVSRQAETGCFGARRPVQFKRRLLTDVRMSGGCSSHLSGIVNSFLTLRLLHKVKTFRHQCSEDNL